LQINLSYAAALILEEVDPAIPTWYSIYESDIDFTLPSNSVVFFGKKPGKKRRGSSGCYRLHRSERLELFRKLEGLMDS
jgi:hypothetical protein